MNDESIEALWREFTDIPIDSKTEKLQADFCGFKIGTDKIDVWHWFDVNHSKGIAYLLYEIDTDTTDTIE